MVKVVIFVLVLCALVFATPFSDGYKAGYKAGYCYQAFGCLPPLPPLVPLPRLRESTFEHGYNRGFLAGLAKKRGH